MRHKMKQDKIIYNALISREKDIHFKKLLQQNDLQITFKELKSFYKNCGNIKIPYVTFENKYQRIICQQKIFSENINSAANFIVLFLSLSLLLNYLMSYASISILYSLIAITISATAMFTSAYLLVRSQQRKAAYIDLFSAILMSIIDYHEYSHKDQVSDQDLIRFMRDIKDSKIAIIKAKKYGFNVKETDLANYLKNINDYYQDIANLENEASPVKQKNKSA